MSKSFYSSAACPSLDDAIMLICEEEVGVYTVSTDAPSDFQSLCDHLEAGNTIEVYSGGSDFTIFSDPKVNYSFRAWHDWCHWKTGADFSLKGEIEVCEYHILQLQRYFSVELVKEWSEYIFAEIVGQRVYYEIYNEHVVDQRAFTLAFLDCPARALNQRW